MRMIFVRRGQLSTYNVLVERCQLLEDVRVRWDRRCGEDRRIEGGAVPFDRRHEERRSAAADLDLRGYTVVDMPTA
jgi:hypothetical protein